MKSKLIHILGKSYQAHNSVYAISVCSLFNIAPPLARLCVLLSLCDCVKYYSAYSELVTISQCIQSHTPVTSLTGSGHFNNQECLITLLRHRDTGCLKPLPSTTTATTTSTTTTTIPPPFLEDFTCIKASV